MGPFPSFRHLPKIFLAVAVILVMACSSTDAVAQSSLNTDREVFKLNYAISLYASSRFDVANREAEEDIQILDKALVRQRATDYIDAWNTRNFDEIKAKLQPVLSPDGTYSDPGETAYGVDEVAKTAMQMHNNLGGLIRTFVIAGEPELIEHTEAVYYNVKNLMIYNWDWQQEGKSVLHGKELTIFDDDQMIHYDMGIFATGSFPHFEPMGKLTLTAMENTIKAYLSKLNNLSSTEKYQIVEAALTDPSSTMNGGHNELLSVLKTIDLGKAEFVRAGKASVTSISIAYPWKLKLGDEALLEGTEVNVFDKSGEVKYAFGFSGN